MKTWTEMIPQIKALDWGSHNALMKLKKGIFFAHAHICAKYPLPFSLDQSTIKMNGLALILQHEMLKQSGFFFFNQSILSNQIILYQTIPEIRSNTWAISSLPFTFLYSCY